MAEHNILPIDHDKDDSIDINNKRKTCDAAIDCDDIEIPPPALPFMRLAEKDVRYYICRYNHYYGHQARLCNEGAYKKKYLR